MGINKIKTAQLVSRVGAGQLAGQLCGQFCR